MSDRRHDMLRALDFIGLRRRSLVGAIALGAVGALSALGLAALSAWLITRAWQMPPILYLSVAVTGVRALGISRALFRYLERLASHRVALEAMASARGRVYRALAGGSGVGAERATMLARTADDVDEIGDALVRGLVPMAIGMVTGIAAVAIMAVVSPLAAVVLAIALLISGLVAPALAVRASRAIVAAGAAARERVGDAVTTGLWHGPELMVAGRRDDSLARLRAADADQAAAVDDGMIRQARAAALTPLAMLVSVVAAAVIGVDLASGVSGSLADVSSVDTAITPMLFGVLLLLPLSSFETTGPLTDAAIAWERGRQAAARVMALVDEAGGDTVGTDPHFDTASAALTVRGLQWGRERPLGPVDGLDLDLAPGARLVITGASGVGKSTLGLTLAGLLEPLAGTVVAAPSAIDATAIYSGEDAHLFSTTLRENLRVARGDLTDDEISWALAEVGLDEWAASLPDGLDTELIGGGAALSGGQRRRILLARALVHPAPIVVLDEPTEHLDRRDAPILMGRIIDRDALFSSERIVIVITHRDVVKYGVDVLHLNGTIPL